MLEKIWRIIGCMIGDHDWTCKAEQKIAPKKEELSEGIKGFESYAKTYCKWCGKVSKLSL